MFSLLVASFIWYRLGLGRALVLLLKLVLLVLLKRMELWGIYMKLFQAVILCYY